MVERLVSRSLVLWSEGNQICVCDGFSTSCFGDVLPVGCLWMRLGNSAQRD